MDQGPQWQSLERVRRRSGDCIPAGRVLTLDTPETIRFWGGHATASPLYSELVETIAESPSLIEVLNEINNLPRLNLLFAAVHYMLEGQPEASLRLFYPSLEPDPLPAKDAGPPFVGFVLENRDEIVRLGCTRYTQTNECRRCVALTPAVMSVADRPFHLIDVGTSAGLNLALDRYAYDWSGVSWGGESPVLLMTDSRGRAPLLRDLHVERRIGIDIDPVDLSSEDDRRWLRALVWPDQLDRRRRLESAMTVASGLDLDMRSGDAVEVLGEVLADLPHGESAVVMNSFVFNQLTEVWIDSFERMVDAGRADRPIHRVSFESIGGGEVGSAVKVDSGGGWRLFARAHHHGGWVEF